MNRQFADFGILYIDDEEKSLKYFSAIFSPIAPIYTARSPEEGYRIFVEKHDQIGLVLSDKKMPNESGIDLLRRIEAYDPQPFRFLVTAFADLNVAVDALNDGLLYSYLSKPWDPAELEHRLIKAMKHFHVLREREELIREKSDAFAKLAMADKAAGIGILSTGLNHHLRNSLTVLKTFHEMLPLQMQAELEGPPRDESFWSDYYEEVGAQMDKMTRMLTNLAEGVDVGSVDLHETIEIVSLIGNSGFIVFDGMEIEFELKDCGAVPTIQGNSEKVGQMMRLLFQEAKALISSGGKVEVLVEANQDQDGIVITILNDGELIPEADLHHLFDPFFVRSRTPEELGTNMLACYLTAYHHGGRIRAFHSVDGRNAIEVQLPAVPPAIPIEERSADLNSLFVSPAHIAKECDTALPG